LNKKSKKDENKNIKEEKIGKNKDNKKESKEEKFREKQIIILLLELLK